MMLSDADIVRMFKRHVNTPTTLEVISVYDGDIGDRLTLHCTVVIAPAGRPLMEQLEEHRALRMVKR